MPKRPRNQITNCNNVLLLCKAEGLVDYRIVSVCAILLIVDVLGLTYPRCIIHSRDPELGVSLSEEEKAAAEESLTAYCEAVEFYNFLGHRATEKPRFLKRNLCYKIQEKHKRRLQLSVSIPNGLKARSLSPFYVLLAKPISTSNGETLHSSSYRFKRALRLIVVDEDLTSTSAAVNFILPEFNILSRQITSGSIVILLLSFADITFSNEMWLVDDVFEGQCLMGKMSLDFLLMSTEISQNLSRGKRVGTISDDSLSSYTMSCSGKERRISFCLPHEFRAKNNTLQQLPVICTAEELGAKDITPYELNGFNNLSSTVSPYVLRLRAGNVIFNYKYFNNTMQRSEVMEDFTCPFCLMKCGSFEGLQCHLMASHDLLRFDFTMNEDYQAVDVSYVTETYLYENFGISINERESYSFRKPTSKRQNANKEAQLVQTSDMPATLGDSRGVSEHVECDLSGANATPVSNHSAITLRRPQSAKTRRKRSNKQYSHSNNQLLNRTFYHSQTAQPMTSTEVFADEDSEDEIDHDIVDIEDQMMLNDFVDVTRYESNLCIYGTRLLEDNGICVVQNTAQYMCSLDGFVLANGHIPWACVAFSIQHREHFAKSPDLIWCWILFMIKLYDRGLVDAKTVDKCKVIIDAYKIDANSQM